MIGDPCNAPLVPGIYGDQEGLLARVKSTFSSNMLANSGYLLWSPEYNSDPYNSGAPVGPANVFFFGSNSPHVPPSNSASYPYGSETYGIGANMGTAKALDDPAAQLLATDLVQDARCISACMSMIYTGKMMDSSGQVAFIEGLPLSAIIADDGSHSSVTSVDSLFTWSTRSTRLGTDKIEVKFRPRATTMSFRSAEASPIIVDTPGTSKSIVTTAAQTLQPTFFGIAWRGLVVTTTPDFSFELTKCLEWRAAPVSGLTHASPQTINPGPVQLQAVHALDKKIGPGWSAGIEQSVMSNVGRIAQSAFTGASNYIANQGVKYFTEEMAALGNMGGLGMLTLI
jgi:hypothetical protein